MENQVAFRWVWLLAILSLLGLMLGACGTAQNEEIRIGVYDSRSIAVTWPGTESFDQSMRSFLTEYQKAKAAGDQTRVAELEAEAEAQQQLLHKQAFSTAPVDDILAHIEDSLPGIKESAGVSMLVSKWDKETLAKYPSAELVDVTMMLVDAFQPTELQRQRAVEIQETEPISLEEAEKIKDW
jgi:hypothetical protein